MKSEKSDVVIATMGLGFLALIILGSIAIPVASIWAAVHFICKFW